MNPTTHESGTHQCCPDAARRGEPCNRRSPPNRRYTNGSSLRNGASHSAKNAQNGPGRGGTPRRKHPVQNRVEQSRVGRSLNPQLGFRDDCPQGYGCRSPAGSWREPRPGILPGFQLGFRAGGRGSCVPPFGFLAPGSGGVDASRRCISAPGVSADSAAGVGSAPVRASLPQL